MNFKYPGIFSGLLFLMIVNADLLAQTIHGTIVDEEKNEPISYVSIGVLNKSGGTYSDEKGNFEFNLSDYLHSDTLKFSCIGYKPLLFTVGELIGKYKDQPCRIGMVLNQIQLNEVVVNGVNFKTRTLGNRICNKHIQISVFGEMGIIIPNNKTLILKKVSFELPFPSSMDSIVLRLNVYNLKNKLPDENILRKPVYLHLKKEQLIKEVNWDIEKENIIVDKDFFLSLEVVKRYGKGRIRYAAWITGHRTYYRSGNQGIWKTPQTEKGIKLFPKLVVTALYEK